MKKILALIAAVSISFGFCFAQEMKDINTAEPENNGKYLGFIKDMRAGAFFNFESVAGDLSEYVMASIGGGASFEAGIPLPLFSQNSVIHGLLENFGASYRMTFDGGILKNTIINSLFSMRFTFGIYTRIFLLGNNFSIIPEINYGLILNFPEVSEEDANNLKKVYVDQILQFGAGIRFSHPGILDEKLEFEFTPTYSFSPELDSSVHYIGFRFGALYRFADKVH